MYTSRPHNPVPKLGEALSLIRIFLPCGHCSRVTNDQRHGNDNASDEKKTHDRTKIYNVAKRSFKLGQLLFYVFLKNLLKHCKRERRVVDCCQRLAYRRTAVTNEVEVDVRAITYQKVNLDLDLFSQCGNVEMNSCVDW